MYSLRHTVHGIHQDPACYSLGPDSTAALLLEDVWL